MPSAPLADILGSLRGLSGVALFWAAGWGLVAGLGLSRGALRSLPLRLGLAYLLGVAAVAGGLYAGGHWAGLPLRRPSVLGLAAGMMLWGLGAWIVRRVRRAPEEPALRRRRRRRHRPALPALLALGVGAIVTLGLLAEAVANPSTDWDGRMTWSAQARYIRQAGTVDDPTIQKDRWFITHPLYPLLLPAAQAAVGELAGAGEDEELYRPLYVAFYPAFLLVLYGGARRWAGRRAAGWTTLAAAALPFLAAREGGAAGAYCDLALGCFYGAALLLLLSRRPRRGEAIAAGILLAAAVLSKNEGIFLAVFALAAAVWAQWRRPRIPAGDRLKRLAPMLWSAALAIGAVALLVAWRAHIHNRHDEGYEKFGADTLWPGVITRIPLIARGIFGRFFAFEHWALFWAAAPAVLWAGRRGLRRRLSPVLALAWGAPLAIAWGAYSIHWSPAYLISVTWNRMLIQGAIPFLLLLALALREVLLALDLKR